MTQNSKQLLVVVSLMPGNGSTGVEMHFNLIMAHAVSLGMQVQLVTPHNTNWFLRKLPNGLGLLLRRLNIEYATIWERMISYQRLRSDLKRLIAKHADYEFIFYVQCSLSALAALSINKNATYRVVQVCHFGVSEASEAVSKGVTSEGGRLWRDCVRIEQKVLPAVDSLIFVSNFMKNIINKRLSLLHSKQSVISNFPALPQVLAKEYEKISGDLIAIGALENRKNQSYLLYVLAACKLQGKTYHLTVVGDGPDRKKLEQLANVLNINNQVNFVGIIKNASTLISNHHLLVHASRIESFGIVLIEALSYGRPVIAASVGGIPEIITEGVDGFFWNLDDVTGGAKILIRLLENPSLLNEMSRNAGQTFQQKFHPDVLANKWIAAIKGKVH